MSQYQVGLEQREDILTVSEVVLQQILDQFNCSPVLYMTVTHHSTTQDILIVIKCK